MISLETHRLALFEAMVTLNGSTWIVLLAEHPKGRVTPLICANSDETKAPPVENIIMQHLKLKHGQLKAIETTTTGAILYAAIIER